jgi:hypothetical protein
LGKQSSWRLLARQRQPLRVFRKKTHLRRNQARWKARRNVTRVDPADCDVYSVRDDGCSNTLLASAVLEKWNKYEVIKTTPNACPRCGQFEDAPHVVRCKGNAIFEVAVQKLEITRGDKFTAPDIIAALGKRIRQRRKHSNDQTIDQATPRPGYYKNDESGTKAAVVEQERIGWYNLLLGRMSTKWMDAQTEVSRITRQKNHRSTVDYRNHK